MEVADFEKMTDGYSYLREMKVKISKKALLWTLIMVPYLRPDCISGSFLAYIWAPFQILSIVVGLIFILKNIRSVERISCVTCMLVLYYFFQIVSDVINGLDPKIDIVTFVKMSIFLVCICIIMQKDGIGFLHFIYRAFKAIIILNGVSVLLFWNRGIIRDSYNMPIFFWSTKNHIISLALSALAIGYILLEIGEERRNRYAMFLAFTIFEIIILQSSTAIVAIMMFAVFVIINIIYSRKEKPINLKLTLTGGLVLQILVVVFRIQDSVSELIRFFFGKDATFSQRTTLWDQALIQIPRIWVWGRGNSSAAGLSGWLTMSFWNQSESVLEDVYYVAHNQFVEILLNGGIMMMIPFLLALFGAIRSVTRIDNNRIVNIIAGTILAYCLVMVTEVIYPYPPVWIFITVVSCLSAFGFNRRVKSE